MNNNEKYTDIGIDLMLTQAEVTTLKAELVKAGQRIEELEEALRDEMYRHDRQVDWYLARERELEDAKAILRLYPSATTINRDTPSYGFDLHIVVSGGVRTIENCALFPSLKPGETAILKDVVKE